MLLGGKQTKIIVNDKIYCIKTMCNLITVVFDKFSNNGNEKYYVRSNLDSFSSIHYPVYVKNRWVDHSGKNDINYIKHLEISRKFIECIDFLF